MATRMAKPALDAGLVSSEAEALLAFYRAVFGFTPLEPVHVPGLGVVHKLACGRSVLRVLAPAAPPEPDGAASWSARAGIRYLTLEVEDIAAAVAAVRAHGGRVELEPFELRPGRQVAQVFDPDGNMLELGQG